MGYYTAKYELPVCNHTEGIDDDNLGYAKGITESGVPFEVEFATEGENLLMAVIMPAIYESVRDALVAKKTKGKLVGISYDVEFYDNTVLDFGMADQGIEEEDALIHRYVDYLVESGIVTFTSNVMNGIVMNRVDVLGNNLVKIVITMTEGNQDWACTDMDIEPFRSGKKNKVVSFRKMP